MFRLTQNNFFGGMFDYEMMSRQDVSKYSKGATILKNFNILKRGAIARRQGFDRLLKLSSSIKTVRLIPYSYSPNDGFLLCVMPNTMTIYHVNENGVTDSIAVENGQNIYASSEIDDIDYQQCGDTLFMACSTKPPAKIEHTITSGGVHRFKYEKIDLKIQSEGVPSIASATVSRAKVDSEWSAPYTEYYKVSAVYNDGSETYPSDAFGGGVAPNYTASWSGTSYLLPWTESQKIKLKINIPSRIKDGVTEAPKTIRIYKKNFNYYGLIGTVDTKKIYSRTNYDSSVILEKSASSDYVGNEGLFRTATTIQNSGNGTCAYILNGNEYININKMTWNFSDGNWYRVDSVKQSTTSYNHYLKTYDGTVLATTSTSSSTPSTITFEIPNGDGGESTTIIADKNNSSIKVGALKIAIGFVYYTVSSNGGSVEFIYTGQKKGAFRLYRIRGSNTSLIGIAEIAENIPSESQTVTKNINESDVEFENRWRSAYTAFVSRHSTTTVLAINIPVNTGSYDSMKFEYMSNEDNAKAYICAIDITGTADTSTTVDFEDNYISPDGSITPPEKPDKEYFSENGDYPKTVSLTQQRLVWASTNKNKAKIWMSKIGDFYSYSPHEVQVPNDPFSFNLPVTKFGEINHIIEMRKLLIFNSGSEWMCDSSSSMEGLTYETIQAYPQSYSGSSKRLKPIVCNNSVVFCERGEQSVRRFAYEITNDGFAGKDVSILCSSIFDRNSIVDWTYQQFPFSTLWCCLKDGGIASFEYMEEQDIAAWMIHELGGGGKARAIACTCSLKGNLDTIGNVNEVTKEEEVFIAVERDGELWLERMRPRSNDTDSIYHALCLDSVTVAKSSSEIRVENKPLVYIGKDGNELTFVDARRTVSATNPVYIGYPFESKFVSVYPTMPYEGYVGEGQFGVKNICSVAFRLLGSYGGEIGTYNYGNPIGRMEQIRYDDNIDNDATPRFENGNIILTPVDIKDIKPDNINTTDGRVIVRTSTPYQFGIMMYAIDVENEMGGWNGSVRR